MLTNSRPFMMASILKKFHHFNRDETVCTQWGIPQNHFIVGTVAALVGHKDYPNFLEAAKIVKDSNKNISFIAVGGGKDEHKLRQLAAKLELGNRFIFTGFQKNVGPIFRCFDLFVAASNKEGLGTSVLDALALAIPVVSTDAGGLPEAVQHNYNGLVVPKKNYKALAAAILTIATQPDLHAKFSKFALPSVEKFAIHVMVDKTIELYLQ